MAESVAIDFRATGVASVTGAFNAIKRGFDSLRGAGDKGETKGLLETFSQIGNTITGIRSAIGGVTAVIGTAVNAIKGLAATGMQLAALGGEAMGVARAFEGLTKKAGESADTMLTKVRAALNETVSDTEIMRNVNIALQLGLPGTADEMARLADVAQRLGRAVGRGPTLAFQDLVTGIGRQSRLILDNLGIVVDSEAAYKKYASTLGKSADDLTDLEKKQAFFNAAMEKGTELVEAMGDEQLTATDNIATVTAAWDNLKSEIGELIATSPGFRRLMEGIRDLIKRVVNFVGANAGFITNFLNTVFELVQELANFFLTVLIPVLKMIMTVAKAVLSVVNPLIRGVTKLIELVFGGGGGEAAGMPGAISPLMMPMGVMGSMINAATGKQPGIEVNVDASGATTRDTINRAFDEAKGEVFSVMDENNREIRRHGKLMEREAKNRLYVR